MNSKAFSKSRLDRMHAILDRHVTSGDVPGLVALVARDDEVHAQVLGSKAIDGIEPMKRDTIFRVASLTKAVTAVAAMILIEECRLRLDDSIDALLPELASRRVLSRIDGPLDDTIPARRSITVRDLLTMRMGLGHIMTAVGHTHPIMQAAYEMQLLAGPPRPQMQPDPDEWLRRVGVLPLVHHPGEQWMYDISSDVLGALVSRAANQSLDAFMRERIFEPLGMKDTGFSVTTEQRARLATSYTVSTQSGNLEVFDDVDEKSQWAQPPLFASGSGGLVSTADDFLSFAKMLLNNGRHDTTRILSRPAVELMTSDHLTSEQLIGNEIFFGNNSSWGFGVSVNFMRHDLASSPGRYGWTGGLGTAWANDPAENMIGILMSQRAMTSPVLPPLFSDFWTSAYQAIDD